MPQYMAKIGLEVHVELATRTKMFCRCPNDSLNQDPNTLVCPVCLGYPGTLPIINRRAIEISAKTAMALGCEVRLFSRFDRKNYFYPDLPKGYQITQYFFPIGVNGALSGVGIERVHLEEDTAKMIHAGKDSLIDFNRAGVPLLEIVSRPDINSSAQAMSYLKSLRDILLRGGYSLARMQLGEFRCDANISLLDEAGRQLGEVVEIKNLNSFRNVGLALDHEFQRQVDSAKKGDRIIKETRGFNAKNGQTYSQRIKEKANDYRYFPEPDLPPVVLDERVLADWRDELGLSSEQLADELRNDYQLDDAVVNILVRHGNEGLRNFWLGLMTHETMPVSVEEKRRLTMFVLEDLWAEVKNGNWDEAKLSQEKDKLMGVLNRYTKKDIDKLLAKELISKTVLADGEESEVIGEQLTTDKIIELFYQFMAENPDQSVIYQKPEKQGGVENFFIGYVKRQQSGRGEVEKIRGVFRQEIKKVLK